MRKYKNGSDLDFLCAIANELAESNRLKKSEIIYSALKEGVDVKTIERWLQNEM